MWFTPRALSIITTHKCTAACEHCCFSCSPSIEKSIPIPRLYTLVEEAAAIPTMQLIVFTGGECFLLGSHLDALIRKCTDSKLLTRCVTNGYWATSERVAHERAESLKLAGLREINFSTGVFHSKYVPIQNIIWGANACASKGINVIINVEHFAEDIFDFNYLATHPLIVEHSRNYKIQLNKSCWMPNGAEIESCTSTGKTTTETFNLTHPTDRLRFSGEANKTACVSSLSVLTVNPDQELITCCGLTLEYIKELHVSSIKDKTLSEAIAEVQPDLLKMWIHVEGPEKILDFVKTKRPNFELPVDSSHICHTCQYLHSSVEAKEVLVEHSQEVEDRVLEKYYMTAVSMEVGSMSAVQF